MTRETKAPDRNPGTLAEEAEEMVNVTALEATGKIEDTRRGLIAAIDKTRAVAEELQKLALKRARITDRSIRQNTYTALGIALSLGAIAGCIIARQCSQNKARE